MKTKRRSLLTIPLIAVLVVCIIGSTVCIIQSTTMYSDYQKGLVSENATAEAVTALTNLHGEEVRGVIQNFELKWGSLQANLDPSVEADLALEDYVEYDGSYCEDCLGDFTWRVTTSAVVTSSYVLEYDADSFKAVADVVRRIEEVTTAGVPTQSEPWEVWSCNVYKFVNQGDIWKMAGKFLMSDERYEHVWEDIFPPNYWLKTTIGELPSKRYCLWWEVVAGQH